MRIQARKLLTYSTNQLWDILTGEFILIFDDNVELCTNSSATIYSSYFWDMHRKYPKTPLNANHHFTAVTDRGLLKKDTHITLLENIYWDVIDTYHITDLNMRDTLLKLVYDVTNIFYNDITLRLEEYITSMDLLDFIEITEKEDIKHIIQNIQPTDESIKQAYVDVTKIINSSKELDHNPLVKEFRAGMAKQSQALQCLVARGFLTDIDSSIFPIPISTNYLNGLETLHDVFIESRSAAKSVFFSVSILQNTEYFARRLQLITTVVERLIIGDCNSTQYLAFRVNPKEVINDKVVHQGDLKHILGKYYLNETTNTLKIIKSTDTHLEGTTIKIRSIIYCKHPDKHAVCSVCFGQLSDNAFNNGNIGHQVATTITKQITQSVLSTKHLDGSSIVEPIVLNMDAKKFFIKNKDNVSYMLLPEVIKKELSIIVDSKEAFGLSDIYLTDIRDINPLRVSAISTIAFTYTNNGNTLITPIVVSQHKRNAMMTKEFLHYIKHYGYSVDIDGNFVIDLKNWNPKYPILKLPEMEYNFGAHSDQVASIIESKMKNISDRTKPDSPAVTLTELFDLVNSKLSVNIALLEIIIYATMIHSPDNYDLSRHSNAPVLGIANMIMRNRSISNLMGFEEQANSITNPDSFFKLHRPDSIFDCLFKPHEVTQERKRNNFK